MCSKMMFACVGTQGYPFSYSNGNSKTVISIAPPTLRVKTDGA